MIALSEIPSWVYKILLVLAAMIWGFSFVVMKDVVTVMPPAWLLGIRFTLAGFILLFILRKRVKAHFSKRALGAGMVLAVFDFSAFLAQTVGLQHTTPGINAFLTATYCVVVPFAWWVLMRKRPSFFNIGAAGIAVVGIWLVSVTTSGQTFSIGFGESLTMVSSVLFAVHIVFVSKFTEKHDALMLTVFQFITEGCFGCIVGAATETLPAAAVITPTIVGQMVFLIVFASIIAFGIQNVSLAYVNPSQAALLLSLESVFGVLFSVLLYGEVMTSRLLVGFALIFVAILVNEVVAPRVEAKRAIVAFGRDKWKRTGLMTNTTENIILIGMPGAGKSTLGVVLAKILGYEFIDADLLIQGKLDKTLQKIIDACGPDGFIEVENEVLCTLSTSHAIIATGGSAVYSDEAMKHLSSIGTVVYLQVSYEELENRLGGLHERGVVMKNGIGMSLADLYEERVPLYEKYADLTIDINGLSVRDAARKLVDQISML